MGVVLDTSVLIGAERGLLRFEDFLRSLGAEPVTMAAITASELLHGCHRASDAGVRTRRAAFVESLLEVIPVLSFGILEARRHAELWSDLADRGEVIGSHNMLIAGTSLARGYGLATLNRQEFSRIPGLRLVATRYFETRSE